MGIPISSAGIKLLYAVETTKGVMPTTNAIKIPDIKEIPDFNVDPEKLETTTFDNLLNKSFINGLKDLSGASAYTANFTEELLEAWNTLVGAYETAKESGLNTWFFVVIPKWKRCCAYTGEPAKMGLPGVGVNSVYEVQVYITPTGDVDWTETIPTEATT